MKKLIYSQVVGLLLICLNTTAQQVKFEEKIQKEFTVPKDGKLSIYNIFGFIKVEGYAGNKIIIEIDKTFSANNASEIVKAKNEFQLKFEESEEGLLVYIAEPRDSRPNYNQKNWDKHQEIKYQYDLDFTVKVPFEMSLEISTINEGDILVKNVAGALKVNNINGAIAVENAQGKTSVHTINGNVDVIYASLPDGESDYYTLNGDLNISYPANLSADCEYKSFNGELFTDFPEVTILSPRITKNKETDGVTTKYKVSTNSIFRIGKEGGQKLYFETFNGNIYIKKQS